MLQMSRELSFRSWGKNKKKWYLDDYSLDFLLLSKHEKDWIDGLEWQQFTGRLDKNGIKIYEGDIITYPLLKMSKGVHQIEVKWSEKNNGWNFRTKEAIIIGNIHENPDLIK